jgi:hypothetical protein
MDLGDARDDPEAFDAPDFVVRLACPPSNPKERKNERKLRGSGWRRACECDWTSERGAGRRSTSRQEMPNLEDSGN